MAPVKKPQPSSARKGRKPTTTTSTFRSKQKNKPNLPPPKQVKTKRSSTSTSTQNSKSQPAKSKKKATPKYTDAQLNLPSINSIIPASATAKTGKGAGKKRDKVYVDDTESMMTILAMVNAEKEGQIESKVLKARQMEEIREARRKEAEKRAEGRRGRLEGVKEELKHKNKGSKGGRKSNEDAAKEEKANGDAKVKVTKKRKSVSFA